MTNLFVTVDTVEGDQDTTLQTIQLSYQAFSRQVGGIQSTWDRITNKGEFPSGANRSPNSFREIHDGLVLELAGGTAPPLTLPLDTFEVGYELQFVNNVGHALYKPLIITSGFTEDTARLVAVMATGKKYETARLLKYEHSAFPTAGWLMSNVRVNADRSQAAGDQAIKQFEFTYDNLILLAQLMFSCWRPLPLSPMDSRQRLPQESSAIRRPSRAVRSDSCSVTRS